MIQKKRYLGKSKDYKKIKLWNGKGFSAILYWLREALIEEH
jgi:hypothetical protein